MWGRIVLALNELESRVHQRNMSPHNICRQTRLISFSRTLKNSNKSFNGVTTCDTKVKM